MPNEAKIFRSSALGTQGTITLYESFGWQLHSWGDSTVTMTRDVLHPAYATLAKHEADFERLFSQYLHLKEPTLAPPPPPVNKLLAVIGFVCGVIPGVAYLIYKGIRKKKYEDEVVVEYERELAAYEDKKRKLLEETKHISAEAKDIFFERTAGAPATAE